MTSSRRRRARLVPALVVAGAAVLAAAVQFLAPPGEGFLGTGRGPDETPREARLIAGIVLADGRPVAGARVSLIEDVPPGDARQVTAGADGRFQIRWKPTGTLDRRRVFLRAEARDDSYAFAVVPLGRGERRIELPEWTTSRGILVDAAGERFTGAEVLVDIAHDHVPPYRLKADDGSFLTPRVPVGATLDLLVVHDDVALVRERRFRAGDPIVLRVRRGYDAEVRALDPAGEPIRDAVALPPYPWRLRSMIGPARADARGVLRVDNVSEGGDCLLRVEARGFLAVRALASPHTVTPVVLWPAREVAVSIFDPRDGDGIDEVSFQVIPDPPGDGWWGELAGMLRRDYTVRPGETVGSYRISLPACPTTLRLTAPGHADAEARVPPGNRAMKIAMPRLPTRATRRLELHLPGAPDGFPIVAVNLDEDVVALVRVRDEHAFLLVPPESKLQIASPQAYEGFWLPLTTLESEAPREDGGEKEGEDEQVTLGLRPALPLEVIVHPAIAGEATLTDLAHEKVSPPQRARLERGRARFWMRPLREVRVEVATDANFFPHAGEFSPEEQGRTWEVNLRPAAGISYRVRDRAGNAVPFAYARIWEPRPGGRMNLRGEPRILRADATGLLRAVGLRGGDAVVELRSTGLRTRRFSPVRIEEGQVHEGGEVVLRPPVPWRGHVLDPAGSAITGTGVRVLEPAVRRLRLPGGAEMDLYDLQAYTTGPVLTDREGRFEIGDSAPRHPLLALYPSRRADLAPMAFVPPRSGAGAGPGPDPDPRRGGGGGGGIELRLRPLAYIELEVPGSVEGVYRLLQRRYAVLVRIDPPMSLRPLPVVVPSGRVDLFVRLRDRRWGAAEIELAPGENRRLQLTWQR